MAKRTLGATVVMGPLPTWCTEGVGWDDLQALVDTALAPSGLVCELSGGIPDQLARARTLSALPGVRVCEARLGSDPVFLVFDPEQGPSRALVVADLEPAGHFGLAVGDSFQVVLADPEAGLAQAIVGLYRVAPPPSELVADVWCSFCNTEDEVARLRRVIPGHLHSDLAGKLVRESADHWPNTSTLRAFLPRLYEVLAPPVETFALFPSHPFEVLRYHQFASWPHAEREAVAAFWVAYVEWRRAEGDRDAEEWAAEAAWLAS